MSPFLEPREAIGIESAARPLFFCRCSFFKIGKRFPPLTPCCEPYLSTSQRTGEREREGIKNKTSRSFELFCEKRKFLFCSWSFDRKETSILLSLSLSLSLAHFPSRLLPALSARAARSITLSLPCFLNLNCYLLFFFSLFFLGRSCRSRQSPLSSQSPLCRLLPLIKIGIIKKKNYHLSPLAWS